ncbi:MAG TPA: LON peptidase substrate-binding domain-containing protein [Gemmatimonadaceae bacterium]|nr:LON peptidase substrate-binding domain-containing protein [Gemmatimonadaceae bacterium]
MSAARRLPLFPLPLVLFPDARVPLHIFEPRYRQMMTDVLAGDRRFGIVYRPDGVAERELPPGHVGCVACVETSEVLPDGRSNVLVRGGERFALTGFAPPDEAPYHVGWIREFDDDTGESAALAASVAVRVRDLFTRVGRAARALTDDRDPLPDLPDEPARVSFAIAAVVDLDPTRRQRLLASRSPVGRLRELEDVLAPALESLEQRAAVHLRSKSNGHGPQAEAGPSSAAP